MFYDKGVDMTDKKKPPRRVAKERKDAPGELIGRSYSSSSLEVRNELHYGSVSSLNLGNYIGQVGGNSGKAFYKDLRIVSVRLQGGNKADDRCKHIDTCRNGGKGCGCGLNVCFYNGYYLGYSVSHDFSPCEKCVNYKVNTIHP